MQLHMGRVREHRELHKHVFMISSWSRYPSLSVTSLQQCFPPKTVSRPLSFIRSRQQGATASTDTGSLDSSDDDNVIFTELGVHVNIYELTEAEHDRIEDAAVVHRRV